MLLKVSSGFLVAVGLWGRHVCGVGPMWKGGSAVSRGDGQGWKVLEMQAALTKRIKARATSCVEGECPEWPEEGDHFRVPYVLRGDAYSAEEAADFKWVLGFIGRFTNVKFVEKGANDTGKHVQVKNEGGLCFFDDQEENSEVVNVHLSAGCITTGKISEVLMLALGFYYEHRRPDRDEYVTVQNICEWTELRFAKRTAARTSSPYDYASILQVKPTDYWTCPKGKVSLVAKDKKFQAVLEADRMSPSTCDLAAFSKMFPGPVKPPKCVKHDMPAACAPVRDCTKILRVDEAACRDECRMKCQHHMARTSKKPACRLRTVEEIADGSLASLPSASSALHPAHLLVTVLMLGGANLHALAD